MLESFGPEHDVMPRLSLHSALGIALLLISPLAMALGFGPTRNHTSLGQHLNFAASVLLDVDEAVPRDCIKADVLAGDNPVSPRDVRAVLEAGRDPGQRIVRVTTSVAIDEPVVTLDISIGCGSRISRRFVAFIDPPSLHLAESAAPAETVPLPSSRVDAQIASFADVARQADASRRQRDGEARADDVERPPRKAVRAPRPPSAVPLAGASPAASSRPRRQAAVTRRAEPKTRTALAAAPRVAGARLRLDPPRTWSPCRPRRTRPRCWRRRQPWPWAPAPRPRRPSSRSAMARTAIDPLLAQVAAAAAAAAGASVPAASPEQERIRTLEADVARMRDDSQKTQQTLAALQARVRQAEEGRYRNLLVYGLAATTLLGLLAAALLWWLRPRQRRRARWFDAQANQRTRAAARAGPSTSAGLASQPAPLSRPASLPMPFVKAATRPAPLRPAPSSGWHTGPSSLMPTTPHSSIGGLEVTTVLGPEVSRASIEAFGGGAARLRSGGDLTMEELIDLEQQAEFFVVLGQDEAAMSLLEGYIDDAGESPLPYLQLLEIHQRRDDRDAFDIVRQGFSERFGADAPDWSASLHERPRPRGLSADGGRAAVALGDAAVGDADARPGCCSGARRARRRSTSRPTASCCSSTRWRASCPRTSRPTPARSTCSCRSRMRRRTRRVRSTARSRSTSTCRSWPEDAAMSDLLSRPKATGRRGAA